MSCDSLGNLAQVVRENKVGIWIGTLWAWRKKRFGTECRRRRPPMEWLRRPLNSRIDTVEEL